MKKIVLLAIATIMGASASFAQLSFGVKVVSLPLISGVRTSTMVSSQVIKQVC